MAVHKTIRIRGELVDLSNPLVMGILNVTPDSFYATSRRWSEIEILLQAERMLKEGARFIDVGGYSSRPGAADISSDEESQRVIPAIEAIEKRFSDAIISIDTFRSTVAQRALDAGARMINDISGGDMDEGMTDVVRKNRVPYIVMHMRGTPQTMKELTQYEDVSKEVITSLSEKAENLYALGVHDIIVDPGFGFAKTIDQNFRMLRHLERFKILDHPLLVGLSRKSMIYKTLQVEPEEALNGTTVLNTVALLGGASILRVHDVKEAVEAVELINRLRS